MTGVVKTPPNSNRRLKDGDALAAILPDESGQILREFALGAALGHR
jgi:hypothetical protein